jgi:hypothetical protein
MLCQPSLQFFDSEDALKLPVTSKIIHYQNWGRNNEEQARLQKFMTNGNRIILSVGNWFNWISWRCYRPTQLKSSNFRSLILSVFDNNPPPPQNALRLNNSSPSSSTLVRRLFTIGINHLKSHVSIYL